MTNERDKEAVLPHHEPGWPDYPWFAQAAAEARAESQRWLAGEGSKYPRYPMRWWPGKETRK
jgi:hypothetical protein